MIHYLAEPTPRGRGFDRIHLVRYSIKRIDALRKEIAMRVEEQGVVEELADAMAPAGS